MHGTVEGEVRRFRREMPVHPRELLYRAAYVGSLYGSRVPMRRSKGHFIALSPSNAVEIVREGVPSSRVHIITNGVDPDVFKPRDPNETRRQLNLPADKQVVLTINEIQARKGIHILIRAAHKIVKELPETYFVIVGRIPSNALWYMSYLWNLLTKLDLHDHFKFTGFVPKAQLPLYINSADVFALSSYAEGAPLVIPEAMACGRLVVATEGAAAGYLPTNLVVKDGDYEGLAHRISYYLSNEKQRKQSAEALRQKAVRELSWRGIAERTLALYRDVMADNSV
jgi:glycosyltransferase involved in cell wall biosynthesis